MTAIVAVAEDGKVWMGGDSAGTGSLSIQTRADPKVFINGDFIFGYTSSFRMGQLLEHSFTPPTPYVGESGMAYMVNRFVPAVKRCLSDGRYESTSEGQDYGGTFITGHAGEIYEIGNDYQVARVTQSYAACGCGCDLALGSLHTTQEYQFTPEERIYAALEAAAEYSNSVRGPFHVISI